MVSTAIVQPLPPTMHREYLQKAEPFQMCLGDTSLCFNVKDVISASSTDLPLAKQAVLSAAHARGCCENRYLCKWPCSRNDTSLKLLSTWWGFPAPNGPFVAEAVITMTTTLLILTDYCYVSLTNTLGVQLRRQHRTKQSWSQFIHNLFVAVMRKR